MVNDVNFHPGLLTWNPIEITITDNEASNSNSNKIFKMIKASGYKWRNATTPESSIEKKKMSSALGGDIMFYQIDADGKTIETWKIHNPFITNINFGAGNYTLDEILTLSMTIRYDSATLS